MSSSKKHQPDRGGARPGTHASGLQPKVEPQGVPSASRHPRPLLLLRLLDERRTGLLVGREDDKYIHLPVLRGVPMITPGATVSQWRRWFYHQDGPLGFRNAEVEAKGTPAPVLAWIANGLRTAALQSHAKRVVAARKDARLRLRTDVSLRPLQLRAAERLIVEIIKSEAPTFASLIRQPTVDPLVARSLVFILSALRYFEGDSKPVLLPPQHAPRAQAVEPVVGQKQALAAPSWSRTQIQTRHRELSRQTPFEVLGVAADANGRTVQAAYMKQLYLWHPDRLGPGQEEMRPLMADICEQLGQAFAVLSDPHQRRRLAKQGPAPMAAAQRPTFSGEQWADKAEVFMRQGAFSKAEIAIEKALELDPDLLRAVALQAWLQAEQLGGHPLLRPGETSDKYDRQLRQLDRVLVRDPRYEKARYYRAQLRKRSGRIEEAMEDFRAVVRLNPRNIGAERELRLHEMRKRGGFFKRRSRPTMRSED